MGAENLRIQNLSKSSLHGGVGHKWFLLRKESTVEQRADNR
jgi:hypothetical protein